MRVSVCVREKENEGVHVCVRVCEGVCARARACVSLQTLAIPRQ